MINKFHPNLIKCVRTMSENECPCLISSIDLDSTQKSLDELGIKYKTYEFISSILIKANYKKLVRISNLKSVEYLSKPTKVSSQIYDAKKIINLENLTEHKYFGEGVNIAFIDTGICPHLDFIFPQNRILEFIDLIDNKTIPYDDNGHGSFVASVCAGSGKSYNNRFSGIAPQSKIIMIKALDKNGETDSNKILDAMEYIYDNRKRLNIKIVCMSFGADDLGFNDPLKKGALALWNSGVVIVAAAGNSGPENNTIKSPGTNRKIITVGGLDSSDKNNLKVADFSSRGPVEKYFKPDLIAPSVNIIGANNIVKNPYTKMSGTSVATPIIAGLSAIILQKFPHLTPDQVKYYLINHCSHIDYNRNNEGYGFINFY